jgi:hypothetical protein
MKTDKEKIYTFLCAFVGVTLTWFINHKIGYGPIVASGIVGLIASVLLPGKLAAATYTASFVGMSSISVIPTFTGAILGGIVAGVVILATEEIYVRIGGKGGTTAALVSLITKSIIKIIG